MLLNHLGVPAALEAEDETEAVALAKRDQPELLLFDLCMDVPSAGNVLGRLKKLRPNVAVLIIASQSVRDASSTALKLGAVGYLLEQGSTGDAVRTLRETLDGLGMGSSENQRRAWRDSSTPDEGYGSSKSHWSSGLL